MEEKINQNIVDNLLSANKLVLNKEINQNEKTQKTLPKNDLKFMFKILHYDNESVELNLIITNMLNENIMFYHKIPFEENIIFKNIATGNKFSPIWPVLASGENSGYIINAKSEISIPISKIFFIDCDTDGLPNISIDIPDGKYEVYINTEMDKNFFCPFSLLKYIDCIKNAKNKKAILWEGKIFSNKIYINKNA